MNQAPRNQTFQKNFLNLKKMMGTDRRGPQRSVIQLALMPVKFLFRFATFIVLVAIILFLLLRVLEATLGPASIAAFIDDPGVQSNVSVPEITAEDIAAGEIRSFNRLPENTSIFPVIRHGFEILGKKGVSLIREVNRPILEQMGIRIDQTFEYAYIAFIDQTFWELPKISVLVKYAQYVDEFPMFKLRNDNSIFATMGQYQRQVLDMTFSSDMQILYAVSLDKKYQLGAGFLVHVDGLFFRRGINFTHSLAFECDQSMPFPSPQGLTTVAGNAFAYNLKVSGLCPRLSVGDGWRTFGWPFWEPRKIDRDTLDRDSRAILLTQKHDFQGTVLVRFRSGGLIEEVSTHSLSYVPGPPRAPEPQTDTRNSRRRR